MELTEDKIMNKEGVIQNLKMKKEIIQHLISFLESESDSIVKDIGEISSVHYDLETIPDEFLQNFNSKEEYHNYYNSIVETLQEPVIDCVFEEMQKEF